MPVWTANNIPDQSGKVIVITGANSGLGYQSVLALARKGAQVVMTSRDEAKGQKALDNIRQQVPEAKLELMSLELASLASVRAFVEEFKRRYDQLDVLMNNAGVMAIPRQLTEDGFERQLGVNHLGHFALTGLLLDRLLATPHSRVVTTSSLAHALGQIHFDDLQLSRGYTRYGAYGQSKLANLLFAFELQRRLSEAGATTLSLAAHPGYSSTNLQGASASSVNSWLENWFYLFSNNIVAQSAPMGALPQLYAATGPVLGGQFYGPALLGWRGYPALDKALGKAYDMGVAHRLWEVSEQLTGVTYHFTAQPATVSVQG